MKKLQATDYRSFFSRGFTVIELLVVVSIIATLSVVLILNFRASPKTRVARDQVAGVIVSDIRRAQSMAVSGSRYQGNIVCGYGIRYVNNTTYAIYAKPVPGGGACSSLSTRNYQAGDITVETRVVNNSNMEIRSSFSNIFFEPPDPKTYINNNPAINGPGTTITIQLKGQLNCSGQTCRRIDVYPSGQISLTE